MIIPSVVWTTEGVAVYRGGLGGPPKWEEGIKSTALDWPYSSLPRSPCSTDRENGGEV